MHFEQGDVTPYDSNEFRKDAICLSSCKTNRHLGKVYYRDRDGYRDVEVILWLRGLSPEIAEGWRTGIALDASVSMQGAYGRRLAQKQMDREIRHEYAKKGWIYQKTLDGERVSLLTAEAQTDAHRRGLLEWTKNEVQTAVREIGNYLIRSLACDGAVSVIYWACGADGRDVVPLGVFNEDRLASLKITGPSQFGGGTFLRPAFDFFINPADGVPNGTDGARGMYIFFTDGKIQDFDEVEECTVRLAHEIENRKRPFVKCVLIGIGNKIDVEQLHALDNMETGTSQDIWDHKVAADMRAASEIVLELITERDVVPGRAEVYDAQQNLVKRFSDGLPGIFRFRMPVASDAFEIRFGGTRIQQRVV